MVGKTKRRAPKAENGEKNMFADLLYCADCGSKLWYHINTQRIMIHYKFVGVIEIPDSGDNYTADTRKGVAVEYVTMSA